eukprot:3910666-Rhodomonas_salina.1
MSFFFSRLILSCGGCEIKCENALSPYTLYQGCVLLDLIAARGFLCFARRYPVLPYPTPLRACYAMSGTEIAYAPTAPDPWDTQTPPYPGTVLVAYDATHYSPGTKRKVVPGTSTKSISRPKSYAVGDTGGPRLASYAQPGTDIA